MRVVWKYTGFCVWVVYMNTDPGMVMQPHTEDRGQSLLLLLHLRVKGLCWPGDKYWVDFLYVGTQNLI